MEPTLCWAVVALTTAASLFLSLALGALRSYSLARLEDLLESDPAKMKPVLDLLDREETIILTATALRGLLTVVGVVALTGALIGRTVLLYPAGQVGGWNWALVAFEAAILGGGLFVAVGLTIPQALGEGRAERVLLRIRPALTVIETASRPLTWFFSGLSVVFLRVFDIREVDDKEEAEDEILSAALAGENEGVIDEATKEAIENLMAFRDADVSEVMTPRIDIISINQDDDLDTMLAVALEHEKSRLPVTEGGVDKIVGILMAKDLLRAVHDRSIEPASLFRKPFFVPETKRTADLLKELRDQKLHMAIVADEYGGTAGLVTIEDLIEEIIGEIDDEHDKESEQPVLRHLSEQLVEADAKLRIDDLNEDLPIKIPEDADVETLGGFIALKLGRIPAPGDRVDLNGTSFEVTEADERRVTKVLIKLGN